MSEMLAATIECGSDIESVKTVVEELVVHYRALYDRERAILDTATATDIAKFGLQLPMISERCNAQYRELNAILGVLELRALQAANNVRVTLMNPKDGKAPTAVALEKMVETDSGVVLWTLTLAPLFLLRDFYSGLNKSLDWLNGQTKAWAATA